MDQIREFELSYGPIPEDYKWFLLTCRGGTFGPEWVDGIRRLPQSHKKFRAESAGMNGWKMLDVFIIGWDGAGNPFGIQLPTGKIVLEDHDVGGVHELAPSLEEFMLGGL